MHKGEAAILLGGHDLILRVAPEEAMNATIQMALDRNGLVDVTYVGQIHIEPNISLAMVRLPGGSVIRGPVEEHEVLPDGGWFKFKPQFIG